MRVGIGPVDVERRHGLRQRGGEGAAAEIELAQREQPSGQRLQLGVQLTRHHLELSLSDDVCGGGALPGKRRIAAREMLLAARIDQETGQQIGELVAGRAVDVPLRGQRLVGCDDLFDQKIAERRRMLPETLEIGLRVAQPVDVIDAQAVH